MSLKWRVIITVAILFIVDNITGSLDQTLVSEKYSESYIMSKYDEILEKECLNEKDKEYLKWDSGIVIWQNEMYSYCTARAIFIAVFYISMIVLFYKVLGIYGLGFVSACASTAILTVCDWYANHNTRDTFYDWLLFAMVFIVISVGGLLFHKLKQRE